MILQIDFILNHAVKFVFSNVRVTVCPLAIEILSRTTLSIYLFCNTGKAVTTRPFPRPPSISARRAWPNQPPFFKIDGYRACPTALNCIHTASSLP